MKREGLGSSSRDAGTYTRLSLTANRTTFISCAECKDSGIRILGETRKKLEHVLFGLFSPFSKPSINLNAKKKCVFKKTKLGKNKLHKIMSFLFTYDW